MDIMAQKLGMDPAEFRMKNLIRREQFPYTSALGWEYDSGDYHTAMQQGAGGGRLQEAARGAEGEAGGVQARRDARADGHRRRLLHRDRRRRPVAQLRHPRHRHVRFRARSASIRPAAASPARHEVARARATRRPTPRSSRPSSALPADDITVEEGNTDTAPYGLGTYGSRSTPVSGAATAMAAPQDQGQGADDRRLHARSARRRSRMGRRPLPREGQSRALQDHDRARLGGLPRGAARHGAGPRGGQLLRSAELDLSVRRLYLRGRHRRRHRRRPRSGASTRSTIAARASTR